MSMQYTRKIENAVSLLLSIFRELRVRNAPFMAGSIAYSAFVSLLPLALLLFIGVSAVGGQHLADYVLQLLGSYLTPAGQSELTESITQPSGRASISVIGFVVLLWGVFRVFRSLDTAFSTFYGTNRKNDLLNQLRDGAVVLLSLGAAILSVVAVAMALGFFVDLSYGPLLKPLLLICGLTLAFLPIYYVFPDVDLSLRDILPGTVVAAVGWTILEMTFGIYMSYSSAAELYGIIGGVILLITWLYFGAFVMLIGAATNVVLAGHPLRSSEQRASNR